MNNSKYVRNILILSAVIVHALSVPAKDADALSQRVLRASHLSRINDVDMKPWHLKINFQLFDSKGNPSEARTIEEWWGGLALWTLRIQSPSYSATVIENRDGDFRTQGACPIPLQIRNIERSIVYPMPMGEDLSKTIPHLSHLKIDKDTVDCIQLDAPPIPLSLMPTFCLDPGTDVLPAINSSKSSNVRRSRIEVFQGHSVALSVITEKNKLNTTEAEVADLSEISLTDDLFAPSAEMKRTTDMHTLKVTTVK